MDNEEELNDEELKQILFDVKFVKQDKMKDKIIIVLIVLLFLQSLFGMWQASRYETTETYKTQTYEDYSEIDVNNEGNGHINYVGGDNITNKGGEE